MINDKRRQLSPLVQDFLACNRAKGRIRTNQWVGVATAIHRQPENLLSEARFPAGISFPALTASDNLRQESKSPRRRPTEEIDRLG